MIHPSFNIAVNNNIELEDIINIQKLTSLGDKQIAKKYKWVPSVCN